MGHIIQVCNSISGWYISFVSDFSLLHRILVQNICNAILHCRWVGCIRMCLHANLQIRSHANIACFVLIIHCTTASKLPFSFVSGAFGASRSIHFAPLHLAQWKFGKVSIDLLWNYSSEDVGLFGSNGCDFFWCTHPVANLNRSNVRHFRISIPFISQNDLAKWFVFLSSK